jgi:hypothetical protein
MKAAITEAVISKACLSPRTACSNARLFSESHQFTFDPRALAQADAGATSVLVNELNSRFFESSSDFVCCIWAARDLPIDGL